MDTVIHMPEPEFKLGNRVILKDSGRRKDTLLAGIVVEIIYSLPRRSSSPARVMYAVEIELGLTMNCEAQDLFLDRRPQH
jgi:hypothetical protein